MLHINSSLQSMQWFPFWPLLLLIPSSHAYATVALLIRGHLRLALKIPVKKSNKSANLSFAYVLFKNVNVVHAA